jgi:hypothetical protein
MPGLVGHQCRRTAGVAVLCSVLWQGGAIGVQAGNLYVYTDAQGQAVITDTLQQVPLEFRGRARTVTEGEPSTAGPLPTEQGPAGSGLRLPSNAVQSILSSVAEKVHPIEGLTGYQTAVLLVAGACLLALLCVLFLTSNPAIRLLAKCLLLFLSLTMLYQLSIGGAGSGGLRSDQPLEGSGQGVDNIVGQVKTMTEQNYHLQDERTTRQLDQAESSTP